jgi:hypothetical protein
MKLKNIRRNSYSTWQTVAIYRKRIKENAIRDCESENFGVFDIGFADEKKCLRQIILLEDYIFLNCCQKNFSFMRNAVLDLMKLY